MNYLIIFLLIRLDYFCTWAVISDSIVWHISCVILIEDYRKLKVCCNEKMKKQNCCFVVKIEHFYEANLKKKKILLIFSFKLRTQSLHFKSLEFSFIFFSEILMIAKWIAVFYLQNIWRILNKIHFSLSRYDYWLVLL